MLRPVSFPHPSFSVLILSFYVPRTYFDPSTKTFVELITLFISSICVWLPFESAFPVFCLINMSFPLLLFTFKTIRGYCSPVTLRRWVMLSVALAVSSVMVYFLLFVIDDCVLLFYANPTTCPSWGPQHSVGPGFLKTDLLYLLLYLSVFKPALASMNWWNWCRWLLNHCPVELCSSHFIHIGVDNRVTFESFSWEYLKTLL